MPTAFVSGDLFATPGLGAYAHGCNCAGAMGKGIAVEFKKRFPRMYAEYKQRCASGTFNLGDVFAWDEDGVVIFNLGTQKTWRTKAELRFVNAALASMLRIAEERKIPRIGMPRIGAGLGGLDWDDVRSLLEELGKSTGVELVVFESYVPTSS